MPLRLIPITETESRTGSKKSRLYARIAEGLFVPAVKFGRRSLWPEHEIDQMVAATIRGANDEEIRRIVRRLVEARAQLGDSETAELTRQGGGR